MSANVRLNAAALLGLAALSAAAAAPASGAAPATAPSATRPAGAAPAAAPVVPATRLAAAPRPAPPVKPGPEPLLTMEELQALFDQGKYADVLKQLPRVMVLRGKAAEPYNKYDLFLLRFETHLRMKATAPALATLAEAQNVTDDPKKVNYCKAVTLLLKRSRNLAYQPTPPKKERPAPIDVVDPESRQRALQAMLTDEMAVLTPKVEKALDGQSLAGIAVAVEALQGLDVLESAAGAGDDAARLVADLRARGNALMAKAVLRMTTRTDEITKDANTLDQYTRRIGNGNGGYVDQVITRRRGLRNGEWQELGDIVKACDQIIPNARGLAKATGGNVKEVEDLMAAAEDLRRKADKARTTNYDEL